MGLIRMACSSALRDARDVAGLTNRELASRADLHEETVSLLMRGHWGTPETRARVRAVLGGNVADLFPHVPGDELRKPGRVNGEPLPTSGPPLDSLPPRRVSVLNNLSGGADSSRSRAAAGRVSNV
jgi:transcriptional regulator with XRE-family HTH domain